MIQYIFFRIWDPELLANSLASRFDSQRWSLEQNLIYMVKNLSKIFCIKFLEKCRPPQPKYTHLLGRINNQALHVRYIFVKEGFLALDVKRKLNL
jgi:hypothetical protein